MEWKPDNYASAAGLAGHGGARLYGDLASWWPLVSPVADYVEEAEFYRRQLLAACSGTCDTCLELGSGGGNNAFYLRSRFRMVLVDPSPGMLACSRAINPDVEHVLGDMRTIRLDRQFDCVFVHDAISYMTTEEDLRRAIATAALHCRPGGSALFAPDHVRETFSPSTDHGGEDGPDRALRYLEWSYDPDPSDTVCTTDYIFALREPDGRMHVEWDRHFEGIFPRATWLRILAEAGFDARVVPFDHSELEPGTYEVFAGTKQ
jgi:SAM-dependent methyltransferase